MKVLFLDLDGVLNNWYHPELIDLTNLLVLKKIIELCQVKIVLISSNKYSYQRLGIRDYKKSYLAKYIEILTQENITIYDVTPYVEENKELEIKAYLETNPLITDFVILDDDKISRDLDGYQVKISYATGLLDNHIKEVMNILNGNSLTKKIKFN